jgi:hypothetical protein
MSLAKKVVLYELKLWLALFRWIVRYRSPGQLFSYAGAITPILWTFIAISALEIPAFHLLLPWESVRAVLDVIGVYGLLWMIGLMAAIRVNRHALTDTGLRLRNNITIDVTLPWDAIASVRARTRSYEKSKTVQVEDDTLSITIAHQTSVEVTLREPREVLGHTVSTIRLYADRPDEMVSAIRARLDEQAQRLRAT